MTSISGDNITFTKENIFQATGGIIERISLTGDSSDTLCSATDIVSTFKGTSSLDVTGNFFEVFIFNNSNYTITLNPGTNMTMKPGPTDTIWSNIVKRYTIIVTSDTTCDIFNLDHNGQPIITEKIITNTIEPVNPIQEISVYNNVQNIIIGDGGSSLNDDGSLTLYGNLFQFSSVAELTAEDDIVYTTGQCISGFIKRDPGNSHRSDSLPTAADIVAAIPRVSVGTSFFTRIQNYNSNKKIEISGNTGTTISGSNTTISKETTMTLLFVVGNIGSGTEAVTAYIMGFLDDADGGAASLITNITSNSYTILESDNTINVDYSQGNNDVTLTLPEISTIGQKRYFITDSGGHANKNNIIVVPSGSDTILGDSSITINSDYSSISMYNDESSNWILY